MSTLLHVLILLFGLAISNSAQAQLSGLIFYNEGTLLGRSSNFDCVGAGVACDLTTTPGRLTLTVVAGAGGVTAVTGTAPIVSSGGLTPAISCATCAVLGGNTFTGANLAPDGTALLPSWSFSSDTNAGGYMASSEYRLTSNGGTDYSSPYTGGFYVSVSGTTVLDAGATNVILGRGLRMRRTTFSNADYTIAAGEYYVAQTGTMSAARTVTLPAASSIGGGGILHIADESGTAAVETIVVTRAGSDTINGGTTTTITTDYGFRTLVSDGTSKWTIIGSG